MRIVITGASGFVGRMFLKRLLHGLRADDLRSEQPSPKDVSVSAVVHRQASMERLQREYRGLRVMRMDDFRSPELETVMSGADVVVHLAWSSVPRTAGIDPVGDVRVNLEGGLSLLEATMKARANRFIFLSSGGTVYGPRIGAPITEDASVNPIDAHACGKVLFEQYVRTRAMHGGMEHIILRPGNLYGDPQGPTKQQGVVEHWFRCIAEQRPIQVWNGSSVVRDYVHIDDMVDALVAALDAPVGGGTFNVGTGVGTSLADLLQAMLQVTGRDMPRESAEGREPAIPWNVLDPGAMARTWGVTPRISLAEGLERTWKALQSG